MGKVKCFFLDKWNLTVYIASIQLEQIKNLTMLLNLTNFSSEPIHQQIVDQVLERIIENEMHPGDELVSIRKLSRQQHVDKTTVARAYRELEKMRIIRSASEERFVINNITLDELTTFKNKKRKGRISEIQRERIKSELEAARQIQKDLLPKILPDNEKISVAAYSTISNDVGGDFYDFYQIEEGIYGILIGDASGKGLPAALLISQIQAIIKSDLSHKRTIKQTFDLLNTYLKMNSSAKNFATLFYGVLDIQTGQLRYVNAGHNFPIIIKQHGGTETLKTTGPALGIMIDAAYSENKTKLLPEDVVILFTDGVPETMSSQNEQFREERILRLFQEIKTIEPKRMINRITSELNSFRGLKQETDDTTIMIIKKNTIKSRAEI